MELGSAVQSHSQSEQERDDSTRDNPEKSRHRRSAPVQARSTCGNQAYRSVLNCVRRRGWDRQRYHAMARAPAPEAVRNHQSETQPDTGAIRVSTAPVRCHATKTKNSRPPNQPLGHYDCSPGLHRCCPPATPALTRHAPDRSQLPAPSAHPQFAVPGGIPDRGGRSPPAHEAFQ